MNNRRIGLFLTGYLWMIALSTTVLFLYEVTNESSIKNRVFLSYSSIQLFLLIFLLITSLILIAVAWKTPGLNVLQEKISKIFQCNNLKLVTIIYILFSGLIGSLILLLGDRSSSIFLKFQPILVWIFFVQIITIILILIFFHFISNLNAHFRELFTKRESIQFLIVSVATLIVCILFFNPSSIPVTNIPNLPTVVVSFTQGLGVLWAILTIEFLCRIGIFKKINTHWISLVIFLGLFFCAGIVWNNISFNGHFFAIGPFGPDVAWFPHSDSVRFDLAAQSILIGEGLNFRQYSDNPLMVGFVTFLHYIQGGNYLAVVSLQTWFFSLIPGIIFLIGKNFFSHSAGVGGGILYILRVSNLLLTSRDNGMANPKILLSDGLVELVLILMILAFVYWCKTKSKKNQNLILIGGLFGLSTLVRANVWLILPVLIVTIFFFSLPNFRTGLFRCFIVFSAVIIAILPWMWRSQNTIGTPFYMLYKFQHSIYEERYQQYDIHNSENQDLLQNSNNNLQQENQNFNPEEKNDLNKTNFSDQMDKSFSSSVGKYLDLLKFSYANTIYSLGNSILILPQNPGRIGVYNTVIFPELFLIEFNNTENSQKIIEFLSLLLVLIPFAIGIVKIIPKNNGFAFILSVYFAYIIASALALTRGSRYSQPVEWIFLLLLAGGMALIGKTFFSLFDPIKSTNINLGTSSHEDRIDENFDKIKSLLIHISIFVTYSFSIFLILPDYLRKPIFPPNDRNVLAQELFEIIQKSPKFYENLFEINTFFDSKEAEIQKGRVIYSLPLVGAENYEHSFFFENPYLKPDGYDMLALYIISTSGGEWVKINLQHQDWPNQSLVWKEALYLGCKQGKATQLSNLVIVNDDGSKNSYQSDPKIFCHQDK